MKKDKKEPFTVNKKPHTFIDTSEDAYYVYIKTIVDHKLAQENPYFPKVYKFKTLNIKNNTDRRSRSYDIQLEKLIEFDELKTKEALTLLEKILDDEGIKYFHNNYGILKSNSYHQKNIRDIILFILNCIATNVYVKDKYAKDAMSLINDLRNAYGFILDLSEWNVMFRRSSYGIQMVITDPLADGFYSF